MFCSNCKFKAHGYKKRKETLVNFGFRLPSAMDNRPLKFEEIEELWPQVVFVSATPGKHELDSSGDRVTELVVRPTGLLDPPVEVRSARGQVDDVRGEGRTRAEAGERLYLFWELPGEALIEPRLESVPGGLALHLDLIPPIPAGVTIEALES